MYLIAFIIGALSLVTLNNNTIDSSQAISIFICSFAVTLFMIYSTRSIFYYDLDGESDSEEDDENDENDENDEENDEENNKENDYQSNDKEISEDNGGYRKIPEKGCGNFDNLYEGTKEECCTSCVKKHFDRHQDSSKYLIKFKTSLVTPRYPNGYDGHKKDVDEYVSQVPNLKKYWIATKGYNDNFIEQKSNSLSNSFQSCYQACDTCIDDNAHLFEDSIVRISKSGQ